jgi:Kef-type K+ transport system membrane component KefB
MTSGFNEIFEFLAKVGIITLLFKVGLESNIKGLLGQLRNASLVWLGDVTVSGLMGFLAAFYILGLSDVQAIFVAIALTATSVGVSVGIWKESGALKSKSGELLVDVAELDDISGITLMAVLFTIAPAIRSGSGISAFSVIGGSLIPILGKLLIFGLACVIFSVFIERHVTAFFYKIRANSGAMLVVVGIGFIIAAVAGLLGFSVAIGAFFAGLAFSRDPESVKIDASFKSIYELFSPFFFIGIGLKIDPSILGIGIGFGAVILVAAIAGKAMGAGMTSFALLGGTGATLIGASMIPRAEIAMIVMQHGSGLGEWAVPPEIFAGMVFVVTVTCVVFPLMIKLSLAKWPQEA